MKVLKNKRDKYTVTLEIEAEYAEVEKAMQPAYEEMVKEAKIPGFRKGKVPRSLFEKHYGTEILVQRASSIVMNECYRQAIETEKLEPVDYPTGVDVKKLEAGKPFIFTLQVNVKPEVKLKKYKGLKIEKDDAAVTAADIDKEIEQMREYYAEYKVVDRGLQKDDLAGYAVKAFDGETPVDEWTKESSGTRVGSNFIAEEFDNALIGMKLNDTKTFTAKIKDDYFMKEVAGKEIRFDVLITEVKERILPELNDEFAKKVSGKITIDELRKDITEHQQKTKSEQVESKYKNDVMEALIEENEVELPEAMIEEKLNIMMRDVESDIQRRGLEFNKYLQLINKKPEELRAEYRPIAEKRAKLDLILEKVAEKEEIKPADDEINAELEKVIKGTRKQEIAAEELDKIKASIPEYTKKYIVRYLTEEKATSFVLDNAKAK